MKCEQCGLKEIHAKNRINQLCATCWIKETKSWFILDAGQEKEWQLKKSHPATFPKVVAEKFIRNYTKPGMTVLDPMAGSGSTLLAAAQIGREAVGIDLYSGMQSLFFEIHFDLHPVKKAPTYLVGDAEMIVKSMKPQIVDYILFSPPYGDILHKSSGGVETRHKKRAKEGLALDYGDHEDDMGNMDIKNWAKRMSRLVDALHAVLKDDCFMTIIVQNQMRTEIQPIAWLLAQHISDYSPGWLFESYRIWCQDSKSLGIWGHPKRFLTSNHHHYCLTFRHLPSPNPQAGPKESRRRLSI